MKTVNNKISMRQALILYIVACLSPITRVFPLSAAEFGGRAGWLSPIVVALILFVLLRILAAMFKPKDGTATLPANLSDVFELSYGKIISKIILAAYAVWIGILFPVYIRYFAEQMLSTMFPSANIGFFIVIMMALVLVATRGKLEWFARFSELARLFFIAIIAILAICLIPDFEYRNILPVTHLDTKNVFQGAFQMCGVVGYITLIFFLGDHISDKETLQKRAKRTAIWVGAIGTLITTVCIATLSFRVVERMPMPFFSTTKLITVMEPFDRMEAFLLCTWVCSDFIIITAFAFVLINIIKKLTGSHEARYFATPIAFYGVVAGMFLTTSRFELEAFSRNEITTTVNIALCFGIPLLTLIVGKIRGKL